MNASMIPLILTPDSSQLHGYGYDAESQALAVEYRSNHDKVTYHYKGVSPEVAASLHEATSKGSFIYKAIKPNYGFDRIEKERDPLAVPYPQEEQA